MLTKVLFKDRRPNASRLIDYGFEKDENGYVYRTAIAKGQMQLTVKINEAADVETEIIDNESGEEYVLHLVDAAEGGFVGVIKEEYENILRKIEASCFDKDIFKSEQARQIIEYVREKYQDELEYLWDQFPKYAVCRRKDSRKWYAILLTIPQEKLGMAGNDLIEILDLRVKPAELDEILDERKYFFGYHMNKRNWLTICLNNTVPKEEIFNRIDASYELAAKKKSSTVKPV
ncbi:MAG: MmcQ/YjbR family DNA-binding protein [Selenomonadaceae bacterium]|nr:MmcQ/YjbR family DNA-binding protein [Selenomonadaceae bacterium]